MAWYQGFRSADNGNVEIVVSAILDQLLLKDGVRQVSAVPCEKVVDPVDDYESQMGSICDRFLRKSKKPDEVIFQQVQILWDGEFRDLFEI